MKKLITSIALVLAAALCFAGGKSDTSVPAGLEDSSAFIIDTKSGETKCRNKLGFEFYCNTPNDFELLKYSVENSKWERAQYLSFEGFSAEMMFEVVPDAGVKRSRWYALMPKNKTAYLYKPQGNGYNLSICIYPEGTDLSKPVLPKINLEKAAVFSMKNLGAEDFVKFINKSSARGISFDLYVMQKGSTKWQPFGRGRLKGYNDVSTLHSIIDIEDCNYIAVNPLQEGDFSYHLNVVNDDLFIEVRVSGDEAVAADDINNVKD